MSISATEEPRPAAVSPSAGIRPSFIRSLTAVLAGGALVFSFLGYLETRKRLDRIEYDLETLVVPRTPKHHRIAVARESTAQFANAALGGVESFGGRNALLSHAIGLVDPASDGLIAEFGVFRGATINHIASLTERTVHGFDSFEGLPEKWGEGFEAGKFKIDGLPKVRPNVVLHKGWFDETLPGFRREHPEPVDFLHLDADLYSSTRTVLEMLGDRLRPGTVVVFDEFMGYPGWEQGEYRAFQEFVEKYGVEFEYVGWVPSGEQVAVRIESIGSASHSS